MNKTDSVTMDGTRIYHHDTKSKQKWLQWPKAGYSEPKKASLFPNEKEILSIDYLEKGEKIYSDNNWNLMGSWNAQIREERTGLVKKK